MTYTEWRNDTEEINRKTLFIFLEFNKIQGQFDERRKDNRRIAWQSARGSRKL